MFENTELNRVLYTRRGRYVYDTLVGAQTQLAKRVLRGVYVVLWGFGTGREFERGHALGLGRLRRLNERELPAHELEAAGERGARGVRMWLVRTLIVRGWAGVRGRDVRGRDVLGCVKHVAVFETHW